MVDEREIAIKTVRLLNDARAVLGDEFEKIIAPYRRVIQGKMKETGNTNPLDVAMECAVGAPSAAQHAFVIAAADIVASATP